MSLQSIIELNNITVLLLGSNQPSRALQNAVYTMQLFKQLSLRKHFGNESSMLDKSVCAALDHFMHNSETLIEAADEYVYQHGVILPPSAAMEIRLIAPVLVFNTALSHHLLASTMEADTERRARILERAKQLYKLALGERSVEYSTEFKFAIINNIAVVCKTTGQVEEANRYLTFLVSLRMHLSSAGERSTSPSVSGFWINIFGKGPTAPAA